MMLKPCLCFVSAFWILAVAPQASWAASDPVAATPAVAGVAKVLEGDVTVRSPQGVVRKLAQGEPVREGELVVTGHDSEVQFQMADQAYLALRADTQLRIRAYQANGNDQDISSVEILKGALRAITGWIGHYNRSRYQIYTPTATLGIRGTDHEVRVVEQNTEGYAAGTYDHVFEGGVTIKNAQGVSNVDPGHAGFSAARGNRPPRTLARIPDVFPKGRHESLMQGMHKAIQGSMHDARKRRFSGEASFGEKGEGQGNGANGERVERGAERHNDATGLNRESTSDKEQGRAGGATESSTGTARDEANPAESKREAARNRIKRTRKP